MKVGKTIGTGAATTEMLKHRGEKVVQWMVWICNLAWEERKVLEDWRKATVVPLYEGKGNREDCNN